MGSQQSIASFARRSEEGYRPAQSIIANLHGRARIGTQHTPGSKPQNLDRAFKNCFSTEYGVVGSIIEALFSQSLGRLSNPPPLLRRFNVCDSRNPNLKWRVSCQPQPRSLSSSKVALACIRQNNVTARLASPALFVPPPRVRTSRTYPEGVATSRSKW
jgi:hypothetical protein